MKTNTALLERYRKIAHRWNCAEYDGLRRDDLIPEIMRYAAINSLEKSPLILEAMCGTGNLGKAAKEFVEKQGKHPILHYLDFSQEMLNQITTPAKKFLGDVREMPFSENFFDRVFIRGALHDLPREFQQEAVQEVYRVLKHGGLFILIVSYAEKESQKYFNEIVNLKDKLAGNTGGMERYFATKEEYCELLSGTGFKIIANPLDYEGGITYTETTELKEKNKQALNYFFEHLPEKIKMLWKVRESKKGIAFNFPYAVLTGNK